MQKQKKRNSFILGMVFAAVCLPAMPAVAQEERWKELDVQVRQLQKAGKWKESLPQAQEALRLAEATFGPEHANTAAALKKVGVAYMFLGELGEAHPLFERALKIREKVFGEESVPVGESINDLAQVEFEEGKYKEAEEHYQRSLAIVEKVSGPENTNVADCLLNLATLYETKGRYKEAEPLLKRALAIDEKAFGPDHRDVADILQGLAVASEREGHLAEAEPLLKRALAIEEKALGPDHPDVAQKLNNLGKLYFVQGRYADAEPLFVRALKIDEAALGVNHPDVATRANNLAVLYETQGRYVEAEPFYKRALKIRERTFGPVHTVVASTLNNFAAFYYGQGRYAEAEPLYKRALAINEKALGPNHEEVAGGLSNLATLYDEQGRYQEAEPLFKRALAIAEKEMGPEHPDVAIYLGNMGLLYFKQGRNAEAEPLYRRALAIDQTALGPDHPSVANKLTDLGGLYHAEGRLDEAEPLFQRALAIDVKALGPDHPDVASDLSNLAALCLDKARYEEAEQFHKRALAIQEKALGADHPLVANELTSFATLYYVQGRYSEAEPLFERSFTILRKRFEYSFAYMSEKDRLQFLGTVQSDFPLYLSFCMAEREQNKEAAGKIYDLLLWQKGLVGTSVAALRARVAASGDPEATKIFEQVASKKSQSARLVATRPAGWQEAGTRLDNEANELEQQLARRVSLIAEQKNLTRTTWKDVQKALKPGDAAVEFVRFPFHDGKKKTGQIDYVALVARPESARPELIQLGEGKVLEGESFLAYRAEVELRKKRGAAARVSVSPWRTLYDDVWQPLEAALGEAKRVYVSVDGVLSQIPLGVLQSADGRRVMEKYNFRLVSSTREVLRPKHRAVNDTAILVGNPRFLLSEKEQRTALNRLDSSQKPEEMLVASATLPANPGSGALSRAVTERGACNPPAPEGGVLCPLPGTATEVQSIGELLHEKHWSVASYQGEQALEEVVKNAVKPRVLHLATHGFFLADEDTSAGLEDPMLRSGLFFAGADRTLNLEPPLEGMENGVLTAYEAAALNLQGTELVVLSACETGRGHVQNGEGVFGLGRALQEAGAESVLMSLWSVPDQETQELMTLFYKNWLGGMDKAEALRHAQMTEQEQVKIRYGTDVPYYWGAFVLVTR
jgi:tetratricopeptide (TPR) repeat protein